MNILYKYCDRLGIVKILGALELKLPYISQVNDPFEYSPFLYCPNDISAIEEQFLQSCKNKNIIPPPDWKQTLLERVRTGEYQKIVTEGMLEHLYDLRQKTFLLSVSKTAQSTAMWAHYSDKHKGAVIGIDFDNIFHVKMKMNLVDYSEQRPKINILTDISFEEWQKIFITKSDEWIYEKEFRVIFGDVQLM